MKKPASFYTDTFIFKFLSLLGSFTTNNLIIKYLGKRDTPKTLFFQLINNGLK